MCTPIDTGKVEFFEIPLRVASDATNNQIKKVKELQNLGKSNLITAYSKIMSLKRMKELLYVSGVTYHDLNGRRVLSTILDKDLSKKLLNGFVININNGKLEVGDPLQMGLMHRKPGENEYIEKSLEIAAYYFEIAVREELPGANFELAKCYYKGKGVELNLVKAMKHLNHEIEMNGHEDAKKLLEKIQKEINHLLSFSNCLLSENDATRVQIETLAKQGHIESIYRMEKYFNWLIEVSQGASDDHYHSLGILFNKIDEKKSLEYFCMGSKIHLNFQVNQEICDLKKMIREGKDLDGEMRYQIGTLYQQLGETEEANQYFAEAVSINDQFREKGI